MAGVGAAILKRHSLSKTHVYELCVLLQEIETESHIPKTSTTHMQFAADTRLHEIEAVRPLNVTCVVSSTRP